jgi:hypothetical protein
LHTPLRWGDATWDRGAPGRPFKAAADPLADRLTELTTLDDADRAAITTSSKAYSPTPASVPALNTAS